MVTKRFSAIVGHTIEMALTTIIPCPACEANHARPSYPSTFPGSPWVYRCPDCGYGFVADPDALQTVGAMYEDAYTASEDAHRKNQRLSRDYFRKARPFLGGEGRLLEVGGACGWFAQLAQDETRLSVVLVEPGRSAVESARKRGLEAYCGFFSEGTPVGEFEVIFSGHVVEHVFDIDAFLRACYTHLSPGGTLLLLTPNADAWKYRLFHSGWAWAAPGEHTLFLTAVAAERVLSKNGFRNIRVTGVSPAMGHYPYFLTRLLSGWYRRLGGRKTPLPAPLPSESRGKPGKPPERLQPLRRLGRLILWAEYLALRSVDGLLGKRRRDELLIVAERPGSLPPES